jgi:hypothetical protein
MVFLTKQSWAKMVYRIFPGIFCFSLLCAVLCFSYSCRGKSTTSSGKTEQLQADSNYIFNGLNLDGWEITNFGAQGPVFVSDGDIILGMGDGCTGITWKKSFPVTDYELSLEAKRVDGNDFFCGITFPAGKDPCSLIVGGWGGTVVGLSCINGSDASENETTTLRHFEKDRWYKIRLKVSENSIQAWIDNEIVVNLTIDNKVISIRPEVELSKPFGIASWNTTAAIRNIRLDKR